MRRLLRQTTGRVHTPDNVPEKRSGVPEKRSGVPEKPSGLTLMSGRLCRVMRAADRVACSGRSQILSWRHLVIAMPTLMISQLKAVTVRGAVLMTALLTGAALPALPALPVMAQSGASDTASTETSATVAGQAGPGCASGCAARPAGHRGDSPRLSDGAPAGSDARRGAPETDRHNQWQQRSSQPDQAIAPNAGHFFKAAHCGPAGDL